MSERRAPDEPRGLEAEGLKLLLEVSRRINAEVEPDAVLETIIDSLVSITRADRGFLMLRRAEADELEFAIARDRQGQPLDEERFLVSRGVIDEVAEGGATRLIDDASNVDALQTRASVVQLRLRTILCAPLTTPRGVIGVLYVDSNALTRRFTPEDVPLVEAFAAQAAAAVDRVRLQRAELERDRMRSQLRVASDIQKAFLLDTFPVLEGVRGALATLPAHEVGGDVYDVTRLGDGRVGLFVGDVAGKGVPGALFSARLLSDVRHEVISGQDPGEALGAVNRIVASRATRGMFVTAFYGILDPRTGEVWCANAGHLPPLLRATDGSVETWERPSGLPLGVRQEATYETGCRSIAPGQVLLVLTDGIYDAESSSGVRFTEARVASVVADAPADPQALVDALLAATAAHTGRRPQADDQTLLAVALA